MFAPTEHTKVSKPKDSPKAQLLVFSPFKKCTMKAKTTCLNVTWHCQQKSANSQNYSFTCERKQSEIMNREDIDGL